MLGTVLFPRDEGVREALRGLGASRIVPVRRAAEASLAHVNAAASA